MQEVRINGETIELRPDSPVGLTLQNPHLVYGEIPAAMQVTFPQIPWTLRNQRIFGYREMPQVVVESWPRFRCEQYFNGHLLREASFLLTEASENGYQGGLVENLSEFFGDYQNKLLSDIDFGTFPMSAEPVVMDNGHMACAFPKVLNPDFYGTNTAVPYSGAMNDHIGGVAAPNSPRVPMFRADWVLRKLALLTNTRLEGTPFSHPLLSNLLLFNTRAIENGTDIVVQRHLPDLKVGEFLTELFRRLFNQAFVFQTAERRLVFEKWEDWLAQPTMVDWSRKAVVNPKPTKILEQNPRLQLQVEPDGGDALLKDRPHLKEWLPAATESRFGEGGLFTVKSRFSPTVTDDATGLPLVKQPGITAQGKQENNKFGPRVLALRGFENGWPVATTSLPGYSLLLDGSDGIAARFWSRTAESRLNQFYLRQEFDLNETDLAMLDFRRKIHVNGVDYLLVQTQTQLPTTKPAACMLVSV